LGIRFTWLAVGLLLIAVLVLLVFTQYRSRQTDPAEARAPVPTVQGLIVAS
jgi:heme exporter protein D